jgi:hypothetical protein
MSRNTPVGTFRPDVGDIAAGASMTVMHRLHFSVFSAGKLWPVKFAPLEIEMSLCNEPSDWLQTGSTFSTSYTLQNVQILYNSVTLDEAVQNSLYSALLANKVLSVGTMGCYQVVHPIPPNSSSYSFSSVRAFSRLAQVWLTFRSTGARASQFICPGFLPGHGDVDDHTLSNPQTNVQARLSIGPHTWPGQQPAASAAEYYYMMINALGTQPNITRRDFENECFTIVWDLCKTPGNPQTSVSTRSGDLVRVELNGLSAGANGMATEAWLTLIDYQIVAVRESGVTLLT